MQLKSKIIVSGKMIESLTFNRPITKGENTISNPFGRTGSPIILSEKEQKEKKQHNREVTLSRNRSSLKRIVHSNIGQYKHYDKFLTLTFRYIPESIEASDKELHKFIKRLRYNYPKCKILYAGVRELQKTNDRNAIHYHLCMFDMPYIKHSELLKIWCKGNKYMDSKKPSGVNIKGIMKGLSQIIDYLTGYELKDLLEQEENDWLQGHKTLVKSRGLIKPKMTDLSFISEPEPHQIEKALSFVDNKITYYRYK